MKKFLMGILVFFLVLVNALAVYGLLDTFVFSKRSAEASIAGEKTEEKNEEKGKDEAKCGDVKIGLSDELIREREEAQRQLEELKAKTEQAMEISDEFGEKLQDLSNPMLEKKTVDFSEHTVKGMVNGKVICIDPKTGLCGVRDLEKNDIIPFKYQDIVITSESFFVVTENGKVGLLDNDGLQVIGKDYDSVEELVKGYFLAKVKNNEGVVSKVFNRNGDIVFSVQKDVVSVFKENANYFLFQENGKFGVVDLNGQVRLPANFDQLELSQGKLYYKLGMDVGVVE